MRWKFGKQKRYANTRWMCCVVWISALIAVSGGRHGVFAGEETPRNKAASKATRRPNILFLLADDQTYRAIGYNNSTVKTPTLDRLARNGVIFDRAYTASPICAASRASIVSGVFPQEHGVIALGSKAFSTYVRRADRKTLAQILTDAGYRTALYGKSHLGDPTKYGFQEGKQFPAAFRTGNDSEMLEAAHAFLTRAAKDTQPFFCWLGLVQPHLPLLPEQKWVDLYEGVDLNPETNFRVSPPEESQFNQGRPGEHYYRDSKYTGNYRSLPSGPPRQKKVIAEFTNAYYAVISRLDSQIGRLIEHLKAEGLYGNTIIIFLSDNGYFLGNHGLGNKITMHEESVRVPMFIHGPTLPLKGKRCSALVSSLDIYPTVLDLACVEKPGYLRGRSLVPLLSDPSADVRSYVGSECVGVGGRRGQGHRMIRTDRWKYILTGVNEEVLFDERADPYELTNLSGAADATVLTRMRSTMRQWMRQTADTHTPPPSTPVN